MRPASLPYPLLSHSLALAQLDLRFKREYPSRHHGAKATARAVSTPRDRTVTALQGVTLVPLRWKSRQDASLTPLRTLAPVNFTRARAKNTRRRVSFTGVRAGNTRRRVNFTGARAGNTHRRVSFTGARAGNIRQRVNFTHARAINTRRRVNFTHARAKKHSPFKPRALPPQARKPYAVLPRRP